MQPVRSIDTHVVEKPLYGIYLGNCTLIERESMENQPCDIRLAPVQETKRNERKGYG